LLLFPSLASEYKQQYQDWNQ